MTEQRHFAFISAILYAALLFQPSDAAAQKNARPSETKWAAKKGSQKQRDGQKNASAGENLKHYSIIVQKNLFRPLGWGNEEKKPTYVLSAVMAVISDTSEGDESRAIIEKLGGDSYYVSESDTFAGGVKVLDVDEQMVTLDRSGEEIKLKLGESTSGTR